MTPNLYSLACLLISLFSLLLAAYAWKRKNQAGALYLAFFLVCIGISNFFYGLMLMSSELGVLKFWLNFRYFGDVLLGPAILIFSIWYTGSQLWLKNGRLKFVFIIPALCYLIVLSNDWHHLYYTRVWLNNAGILPILDKQNGPFYWLQTSYTYLCLFGSMGLLIRQFFRLPRNFFPQFILVFLGIISPFLAHILYLLGFRIWGVVNPVYFGFAITGLSMTFGVFRFQLFELRPIARDAVMQRAPIGILILDNFQRLVEINPAAKKELLLSDQPQLGQPFEKINAELANWLAPKLLANEDLCDELALSFSTPSGPQKRIFALEVTPLRDGSLLTGWLILLRNITLQVETQSRLQASEEKLRFVTENVSGVLFLADSHFQTTYISSFITRFLGYTSSEMFQLEPEKFLTLEAYTQLKTRLQEVARDFSEGLWQKYLEKIDRFELEFIHRDGHIFWGEIQFAYLSGKDHDFVSLIGIARDISERKETEKQFVEQQRALASLDEREQLARELHDNLGQVMGAINLQAQNTLNHLQKGKLDLAQANLQNLSELARVSYSDLRELLLGLRQKFSEAPDFYTALEKYLQDYTRLYNLPVTAYLPQADQRRPLEPAAEVQVLRVIQEALSNIRKHAQASQALIFFSQNEAEISIIIEDNGVGFDLASVAHKNENGDHYGHTIMRDRIASIGGRLQVISAPGQGTRLIISIPIAPEPTLPSTASDMRVVLADDHPLFRDGLRNLLISRGIKVIGTAKDGQQALDQVLELHPDIAILDINMPVLNGLETARQIKLKSPDVRVLMLTMDADEATLLKAIRAGASGYLLKNLDAEAFLEQLDALMRGETPITPGLAERLLHEYANASAPAEEHLTERQQEILKYMAQQLTYAQIAQRLYLSESAIKYHVAQIMERLNAASRSEVLAEAARRGWVDRRIPKHTP
jgi:PAS domain S-box-containing protein